MHFFPTLLKSFSLNLLSLNGKKIVIEGDSITNGVLVTVPQRWTTLLTQAMGAIEVNQGVNSKVLHNGSTCGLPQFSNANIPIKDSTHGLFILALGVNDILYDNGTFTPDNYKIAIISAVQNMKSKGWTNQNILVLSPYFLRVGANNGNICGSVTPTLARYNSYVLASRQACEIERCMYCDISTVYSDADMADLIHPNASGHNKLSNFLLNKNHVTL